MGKHFDHEYKMLTARMVVEERRKISEVSRELDIPYDTIRNWIRIYKEKQKAAFENGNPPVNQKPIRDLEKEIHDLKEENEILKKAMHVFTKKQQ
jgi:transposase